MFKRPPEEDDEEFKNGGAPSAPSSFAQMQLAGMARPAPPTADPMSGGDPMGSGAMVDAPGLYGALAKPLMPGAVPVGGGIQPPPLPSAPVTPTGSIAKPLNEAPTPTQPTGPEKVPTTQHQMPQQDAPQQEGGGGGGDGGIESKLAGGLGIKPGPDTGSGPYTPTGGGGGQPPMPGAFVPATKQVDEPVETPGGGGAPAPPPEGTPHIKPPTEGQAAFPKPTVRTGGEGTGPYGPGATEVGGGEGGGRGGPPRITEPMARGGGQGVPPGVGTIPPGAASTSFGDPTIKNKLTEQLSAPLYHPHYDQDLSDNINKAANQFSGYADPNAAASGKLVQEMLANPSAYDSKMVQDSYKTLGSSIDEQYGLQAKSLDEQMARRGMFNSSAAVGNLGDIGIQHERAKANLAQNLLMDQAHTLSSDRQAALGGANANTAMGLNVFNSNEQAQGNRFDRAVGYEQNRNNTDLNAFNANEGATQSRLGQAMGYDSDIYNRSHQANRDSADDDYRMQQLYLQMMGY